MASLKSKSSYPTKKREKKLAAKRASNQISIHLDHTVDETKKVKFMSMKKMGKMVVPSLPATITLR